MTNELGDPLEPVVGSFVQDSYGEYWVNTGKRWRRIDWPYDDYKSWAELTSQGETYPVPDERP
jgi:hypothetical protein